MKKEWKRDQKDLLMKKNLLINYKIMYTPSPEILKKYAQVFVNFALELGKPIKKWSVVMVNIPECAKPFYLPLQEAILEAGAFPLMRYTADGVSRPLLDGLEGDMVEFFPKDYLLARVDTIDYYIGVVATADKHEMDGVDTKKLFKRQAASMFYRDALNKKEDAWKFAWTIGLYGTQAMADEVWLSLEEYWNEIIEACYLNDEDPVQSWIDTENGIQDIKTYLDSMEIESVHMVWEDCDLTIKLWENRKWMWGSGRNIPSFELFASPDWRGTQGRMRFNQPLYRYGSLIEWIELHFEDGLVTKATATKNEEMLLEMIAQENANKVGEYSLTDSRMSRITKFMGETLYDENVWGTYGNSHIAVGRAYKDAYPWDQSTVTKEQREAMWYNDSIVHTDVISTTNRTVTATTKSGEKVVIYKDGQFTFWNPGV